MLLNLRGSYDAFENIEHTAFFGWETNHEGLEVYCYLIGQCVRLNYNGRSTTLLLCDCFILQLHFLNCIFF